MKWGKVQQVLWVVTADHRVGGGGTWVMSLAMAIARS